MLNKMFDINSELDHFCCYFQNPIPCVYCSKYLNNTYWSLILIVTTPELFILNFNPEIVRQVEGKVDFLIVLNQFGAVLVCMSDCMASSVGTNYTGNKAMTVTRLPCQRWDSQYPHNHSYWNPEDFPDSSVFEANNYCRNPDGNVQGPWCFTNDPTVRWQTCGIGICPGLVYV